LPLARRSACCTCRESRCSPTTSPQPSSSLAPGSRSVSARPQPAHHGLPCPTEPPTVSARRRTDLIPRYSLPPVADLFTDEARFATWLEVEVLAVEAGAALGVVPSEAPRAIRARAGFDVAEIEARERVTDHD